MKDGPQIAAIAALIGDPARANMLSALMNGRAMTASELALEAGVTKQTASAHLSKLAEARLVSVQAQGRHRYFSLADVDVARLLETLMGVAARSGALRTRPGPREPALRHARVCYDHLAGDVGVALYDALLRRGWLSARGDRLALSPRGRQGFADFGIDVDALAAAKRPLCLPCLDWSVRRCHLAGGLGAALLSAIHKRGWATRRDGSRVVAFTRSGERALARTFGLETWRDLR